MKIAIIGVGNVGGTLGQAWAAKGHDIVFGVRRPSDEKIKSLIQATGGKARVMSVRDAVTGAEVVVLATPWASVREAVEAAGNLGGKVLVDATNPLKSDLSGLAVGHTTSGGEEVVRWAPGAKVVKAFNTIGAQHMTNPRFGGRAPACSSAATTAPPSGRSRGSGRDAGFRARGRWPARASAAPGAVGDALDLDGLRLWARAQHRVQAAPRVRIMRRGGDNADGVFTVAPPPPLVQATSP